MSDGIQTQLDDTMGVDHEGLAYQVGRVLVKNMVANNSKSLEVYTDKELAKFYEGAIFEIRRRHKEALAQRGLRKDLQPLRRGDWV